MTSVAGQTTFMNQIQGTKKRPRVQKACDYCRKKKTKCNGSIPCQNCSSAAQCVYSAHKERKRRSKAALLAEAGNNASGYGLSPDDANSAANGGEHSATESKTILALNSRLSSLESMLNSLVSKLDGLGTGSKPNGNGIEIDDGKTQGNSSDSGGSYSNSPDSDEAPVTPLSASNNAIITTDSKPKRLSKFSKLMIKRKPTSNKLRANRCHSYFCIISEKSMEWIKSKLMPKDLKLVFSMEKLPLLLNASISSSSKTWIDAQSTEKHDILPRNGQADRLQNNTLGSTCDFPRDSNLIFGLLNTYYKDIFITNFIVPLDTVISLFEKYYSYTDDGSDQNGRPIFKFSELLIMNIAIALALENKEDVWNKFTELYTLEDLTQLQLECFNNSVYFYDRIHIVSEGMITVQAILLLYTYADIHYSTDFYINNMLSSVAIRFAQELGLNRVESLELLSPEDADLGRRIWLYCHALDMEACYKTGKPPLINLQDVSTLTELDDYPYAISATNAGVKSDEELLESCEDMNYAYFCHISLLLNRIRNKSYYELFSANAQRKFSQSSFEDQVECVEGINKKLLALAAKLHPKLKPRFFNEMVQPTNKPSILDPIFEINDQFYYEASALFKASFLSHMMVVNRVPMLVNSPEKLDGSKIGKLSLDCARSLLSLLIDLDPARMNKISVNWLQVHGFIAYLALLTKHLQFPNPTEAVKDFELMADFSIKVLSRGTELYSAEDWYKLRVIDSKKLMMLLIVRMTLKLLLGTIESDSTINFYKKIPQLRKHVDGCEDMYPEVFQDDDTEAKNSNAPSTFSPKLANLNSGLKNSSSSESSWQSNASTTLNSFNSKMDVFANQLSPRNGLYQPSSPQLSNPSTLNGNAHTDSALSSDFDSTTPNQPHEQLPKLQQQDYKQTEHIISQNQMVFTPQFDFANDMKVDELMNDDAISNLLYSQAYNFPNSFFDGGMNY